MIKLTVGVVFFSVMVCVGMALLIKGIAEEVLSHE